MLSASYRFCLTAVYLFIIQYFNKIGGKISVKLVKYENNKNIERRADSWVYKVVMRSFVSLSFGSRLLAPN